MYEYNSYGEVINCEATYEQAAMDLIERGHVVLNWTDGAGTLLNILLSYAPTRVGSPGGVVDSSGPKLWVGIALHGMFGFSPSKGVIVPEYAAEKLGTYGSTSIAVAELLTAIRQRLAREEAPV